MGGRGGQSHGKIHASFGCWEDDRGEQRRLPRVGRAEDDRTGDKACGNSMSRAEKLVERAQEETEGK